MTGTQGRDPPHGANPTEEARTDGTARDIRFVGEEDPRPQVSVVIEKGIPMPVRQAPPKYPFAEMEVGDSFFVSDATVMLLHAHARRHAPKRFTCRTVVESDIKGVRVWRIQ